MIPAFNEASAPRRLILLLTMATLLSFAVPAAAAFARPAIHLPKVSDPIPVTPTSHPFLGVGNAALKAADYVEEEYFLSGQARVYDWVGSTRDIKVVAGPSPYVTRILVRRPRDAKRFSGNVEVTVLNASLGVDLGGPSDVGRMTRQGDVWIGITTKALTAKALKRFDPVRYAPLDWSTPVPLADRCARPSIIPLYMVGDPTIIDMMFKMGMQGSAADTEDGLVWDMLGQLGELLKSDQRGRILPGFAKPTLYMTGVSQSSLYIRTWMTAFHDRYRTPDGAPIYDGYLAVVGPALLRINQCSQDVPLDDPRQKLSPPGVPYISLSSEGETWLSKHTSAPDVFTAKGGLVTYEVAGGSHQPGEIPGVARDLSAMATAADMARSGVKMAGSGMTPPGLISNDFVWAPIIRGAWHNLERWVRDGVRPPEAPPLTLDANLIVVRDQNGNALGGLRSPYIDVPVAAHTGSIASSGYGAVMGKRKPFTIEQLKALYPDHTTYVARFSAATDKALAGRWIGPDDAAAMKKGAEAAAVP